MERPVTTFLKNTICTAPLVVKDLRLLEPPAQLSTNLSIRNAPHCPPSVNTLCSPHHHIAGRGFLPEPEEGRTLFISGGEHQRKAPSYPWCWSQDRSSRHKSSSLTASISICPSASSDCPLTHWFKRSCRKSSPHLGFCSLLSRRLDPFIPTVMPRRLAFFHTPCPIIGFIRTVNHR